jgi:hypothetical protein
MTKRESAKPSVLARTGKRSITKLSPVDPNGHKGNHRAGRDAAHPGPSRHNAK